MDYCDQDRDGQISYLEFSNFLNWKDKMPSGLPPKGTHLFTKDCHLLYYCFFHYFLKILLHMKNHVRCDLKLYHDRMNNPLGISNNWDLKAFIFKCGLIKL